LGEETIQSYGKKILSAGAGLAARTAKEVVGNDLKIYESGGYHFAISQAEVSDLYELTEHLKDLHQALGELRESRGLDFAMLMVTDIVRGTSKLLLNNEPAILEELPFPSMKDGTRDGEGLFSRKKQLLPVVLGLLES